MVDTEWRAHLPAIKEAVLAWELDENRTIYRQALVRRGHYVLSNATVVDISMAKDPTVRALPQPLTTARGRRVQREVRQPLSS